MKQFTIALAVSAVMALAVTFAIGRTGPKRVDKYATDYSNPITQEWSDQFTTVVQKKYAPAEPDRVIELAAVGELPKEVTTERITPDAPAKMPPIVRVEDEEKPRRKRQADASICTRHNMHKVITNGGRSWRCMK